MEMCLSRCTHEIHQIHFHKYCSSVAIMKHLVHQSHLLT